MTRSQPKVSTIQKKPVTKSKVNFVKKQKNKFKFYCLSKYKTIWIIQLDAAGACQRLIQRIPDQEWELRLMMPLFKDSLKRKHSESAGFDANKGRISGERSTISTIKKMTLYSEDKVKRFVDIRNHS
jgi:hypothetical protein